MLIGLDPRLTPDLLYALARMGHGDEIVIADANFPAESTAGHCHVPRAIPLTAISAPAALEAICTVMPIDEFSPNGAFRMEIDGEPEKMGDVHIEAWNTLERAKPKKASFGSIERQEFYIRAQKAFCVVQTADERPFGCFILRKGVVL